MIDAMHIQEHMEVVGSDGGHVGRVDHMEDLNRIKLTRDDPASGGEHHVIPLDWVERVEQGRIVLSRTCDEVMRNWQPVA